MKVSMIACVDAFNFGIGKNGELIHRIPEDLKRFKELTGSHPLIMGRETFESLGKTLPDRKHIILTRNHDYLMPEWAVPTQCTLVGSAEAALLLSDIHGKECFVIGGEEVFKIFMPVVSKIYLTLALSPDSPKSSDAFFPEIKHSIFSREIGMSKRYKNISYSYVTFTRKQPLG